MKLCRFLAHCWIVLAGSACHLQSADPVDLSGQAKCQEFIKVVQEKAKGGDAAEVDKAVKSLIKELIAGGICIASPPPIAEACAVPVLYTFADELAGYKAKAAEAEFWAPLASKYKDYADGECIVWFDKSKGCIFVCKKHGESLNPQYAIGPKGGLYILDKTLLKK